MARAADRVTAYARQAAAGKIPCGRLVKLAAKRHLQDLKDGKRRGLTFDVAAAEKAIGFFPLLRHSKGQWAGQAFELSPWQAFVVGSLFGWKRKDGLRRFRISYTEVPRKNGKSTLSAGIMLLLAFFDGEAGAEVYCAATKRDQARITFDECKRMVERTPGLRKRIEVLASNLNVQATASKLQPLSADHDTMDGLNVHGAGIDELHAHKTSGIVDVLETATGARRQPLQFEISTAGFDRTSICWRHHDYTIKVLEGTVKDDTWFGFIAAADPGDDWRIEKTWWKANPNLGISVHLDDLQRKAKKAQHLPAQQNAFRRLHLDEWTEQANRWLDMSVWDRCSAEPRIEPGKAFFGGLDVSSTRDLTAWVQLFGPDDDGVYDVVPHFWIPELTLTASGGDRSERGRLQLAEWVEQGFISTTPGDVTDYDFIEEEILESAETHQLREVDFDRWGVSQLTTHLREKLGETRVVGVGQGFATMAAACKELEKLLLAGKIRHGGHPVLRWMASNVAVKQDSAGNVKPIKPADELKIDGISALLNAVARAISEPPADAESEYERRAAANRALREDGAQGPPQELIDSW